MEGEIEAGMAEDVRLGVVSVEKSPRMKEVSGQASLGA